ncbi:MAG: PAS domain S-box protein, partial [Deltaproteobacteria bacterium]|nr:PAS domain S-box protein [Deltaproteobacteria bacterium]
ASSGTCEEAELAEKNRLITEYLKMRQKVGELESFKAESAQLWDIFKKFKALFSEISDLAYICDAEGRILYANESFEKLTGHDLNEFLGQPFHPLFDTENLKQALEFHKRTLGGEKTVCELRFRDTGIPCEFKSVPLKDDFGKITGVIGIAREIPRGREEYKRLDADRRLLGGLVQERTKALISVNEELLREVSLREAAERTIEAHEKNFLALLEAMPEAVIVADAGDGAIRQANGKASAITGIPVEELSRMKLSALGIPRRFHSASSGSFKKAVIRGRGRAVPVVISSTEVDANGRKAVNLVLKDITPYLCETRGRLHKAIERSQSSVVLADINGSIEFVNPVFEKLTGYSAADAAGENIRSFFDARNEKESDEFWLTVLEGSPWRGVFRTLRKDGAPGVCNALVTPVRSGEKGRITHLLCVHDMVFARADERLPRLPKALNDHLTSEPPA